MSQHDRARRRVRRYTPEISALEGRALMTTTIASLPQTAPLPAASPAVSTTTTLRPSQAYVTQVYIELFNRAPNTAELASGSQQVELGTQSRDQFITNLISSPENVDGVVRNTYTRLLGRAPTAIELTIGQDVLRRFRSSRELELSIYVTPEYFQQRGGGTNAGYVQALYNDILGRGAEPNNGWLPILNAGENAGVARFIVARSILFSPESNNRLLDNLYAHWVDRLPDPTSRSIFVPALGQGLSPEVMAGLLATSQEFSIQASAATTNLLGILSQAGAFNTLLSAIDAAGLTATFNSTVPFTFFAPTDTAFANLPAGTLQNLLLPANRAQLQSVLLHHTVSGALSSPELQAAGRVNTIQGSPVTISPLGTPFRVNDANLIVGNLRATNGLLFAIDTVLMPPPLA